MKDNIEIKRVTLPLSKLEMNNGQLEGLPKNPRQWTRTELDKLARSLADTPELLQMRCPIVAPLEGGKFIVLGGNMRLAALRENKAKEVECFVVEGADTAKLREIVIKDNGSFGEWDWDELANQWDDMDLGDWGIHLPAFDAPEEEPGELPEYSDKEDLEGRVAIIIDKGRIADLRKECKRLGCLADKGNIEGLRLLEMLQGL